MTNQTTQQAPAAAPVIAMTTVESSNVLAHGYDEATGTLAIRFKSGEYHYQNVPADVAQRLTESPSIGSFVAREIRPVFDAVKQAPQEAH